MTKAIKELEDVTNWDGKAWVSEYEIAKRIITAQEQRLGELERIADMPTDKDRATIAALKTKVEQQEQRIAELEALHAGWLVERAELTALATGLEAERDAYRDALAKHRPPAVAEP